LSGAGGSCCNVGMRPRTEAFVGVSLDGFLARPDGTLDFLEPWQGHEHGYTALFQRIDTVVFGRATWDFVAAMMAQQAMPWPFVGKRCVVLTHRAISATHGEVVRAATPVRVLDELEREGRSTSTSTAASSFATSWRRGCSTR
jgi:dihydrofolate reductase